jgi:hypothetical protein
MMEFTFTANDENDYTISFDDDGNEINVYNADQKLGSISLDLRDEGDHWEHYHITHLALDGCKRLGIGQRCLELHKKIFGTPLTAGRSNAGQQEDGSHLTGDGPAFIANMRKKGLVAP